MTTNAALTGTASTVIGLPPSGTSAVYKLDPGTYTQFLFKMDQVDDVALRPDGSLEMKLHNGSTLVIQNFHELANSSQTCGRDTIFQMLEDKADAAGENFTSIVNISPDGLLRALDPSLVDDKTITLNEPSSGVTKEVMMEPGQNYKINFDWADAGKTVDGTNLMLSFKNGGLLILRDFVPAMNDNMPPAMTLADGTVVDPSTLIVAACAPVESKVAEAVQAPQAELRAPNIEPAAGESTKVALADTTAESLANIEPAAGGGNAPASAGRGGAGFASGIDPANLNGLSPIGPLGPTSLAYSIPRVTDNPASGTAPAVPLGPQNPPAPVLQVQNEQVYEDSTVSLHVGTTSPAGTTTTIVISGIPATWAVDPGLGTYDAATGTWTMVLPAGATFSGGPKLTPPADADGDISVLDVTATSVDAAGLSSVSTGQITVVTDAVADMPNLTAVHVATAEQDTSAALNIASSLNDLDGSEVLSIRISNLPAGATLSAGSLQADGSYLLTAADLTGLRVIPAQGYVGTFTLLVEATSTETQLSGTEFNFANNIATKTTDIVVTITSDDIPVLVNAVNSVDESNLAPSLTVSGTVNPSYGADTGSVTAQGASSFVASGSLLGSALTHNGVPVVVTLSGNTYTGMAGTTTVFTLQVNTNGTYTFTQRANLDHADGSNPNDVINLSFGVTATDNEGDATNGTIKINILDDAPVANDDSRSILAGTSTITGNVTSNDVFSQDNPTVVSSVSFGGTTYTVPTAGTISVVGLYGTLVIAATGAYTYTGNNGANGTDTFTYNLRDRDGDVDPAKLIISTSDSQPTIGDGASVVDETNMAPITTVNGTYAYNYGGDGAGSITLGAASSVTATGSLLGGALTHDGVPVVVTLSGNTYTGKAGTVDVFTMTVNTNGTYTFVLKENLDHADGANPNDVINLNFTTTIRDVDGDTDTGVITVAIRDDAPAAVNDVGVVVGQSVTGNVLTNDVSGQDNPAVVGAISMNDMSYLVPATGTASIAGLYGVLVIAANGAYTYTANNGENGKDVFTYTIKDHDGDTASAHLTIDVTNRYTVSLNVNESVDDVCVMEDGQVTIPVVAQIAGGSGNETLTLTLTGTHSDWIVTAPGWTKNADGNWSMTLPQGQTSYNGGITFAPPANSDIDLNGLNVHASVYDPDTSTTKVADDGFNIIVDAVADIPVVDVTLPTYTNDQPWRWTFSDFYNYMYHGTNENIPFALKATSPDVDGSEQITYYEVKLPQHLVDLGVTLTVGTETSPGLWHVDAAQADQVQLHLPPSYDPATGAWNNALYDAFNGIYTIQVTAYNEESSPSGHECTTSNNVSSATANIQLVIFATPLVLDLNHDGVHLTSVDNGVYFDINGDGVKDKTGWVATDDALLALDKNHNGLIDGQQELFGSQTQDGFAVLSQYDDNKDGVIDAHDKVWADLTVWQDVNQDGISQANEMTSLDANGFASISLDTTETVYMIEGNGVSATSQVTRTDGSTTEIVDAWFAYYNGADPEQVAAGHIQNVIEATDPVTTAIHEFAVDVTVEEPIIRTNPGERTPLPSEQPVMMPFEEQQQQAA